MPEKMEMPEKDQKRMEIDAETGDDWFTATRKNLPWWGRLWKSVLQMHKIPRHIAFVMDGNRRYARKHNLAHLVDGHAKGFDKLTTVLDWCRELGIEEVTLYAFSIENFRRGEDEVNGLMAMAERKFARLLAEKEKLHERQICFRFFGDLSLLPAKIRVLIAKIESLTKSYKRGVVNVCLAYTSQNEIARAMEWIRKGVQIGLLLEEDIDQHLITDCLDSRHSPRKVDMLIRTSGERRLSDFLLWQCAHCYIHFEEALWPDLNLWHLCNAILSYQRSRVFIQEITSEPVQSLRDEASEERINQYLRWMEAERQAERNSTNELDLTN